MQKVALEYLPAVAHGAWMGRWAALATKVEAGTPTALRSNPVGIATGTHGTDTWNRGPGPKLNFGKNKLSEVRPLSLLQYFPERSQVSPSTFILPLRGTSIFTLKHQKVVPGRPRRKLNAFCEEGAGHLSPLLNNQRCQPWDFHFP